MTNTLEQFPVSLRGWRGGSGVKAHTVLAEDFSSVPSIPFGSSQSPVTPSPGGSDYCAPAVMFTGITHKFQIIKVNV